VFKVNLTIKAINLTINSAQYFAFPAYSRRSTETDQSAQGIEIMSPSEYQAAVAEFIRSKGVTRCPTACVVRTQGTVSVADREALQKRAVEFENLRTRRRPRGSFAAFK